MKRDIELEATLVAKYAVVVPVLDERSRRRWAAAESLAIGYGGDAVVSSATGLARETIRKGRREIARDEAPTDRIRRPGGGRPRIQQDQPGIQAALEALVDPLTRGDPTSPLRWTCKSRAKLAAALTEQGWRVSSTTVGRLLHRLGYRLQSPRKRQEGATHPDRNAQFEHINRTADEHLTAGQPVISVDTKKKELVGLMKTFRGSAEERAIWICYAYRIQQLADDTGLTISVSTRQRIVATASGTSGRQPGSGSGPNSTPGSIPRALRCPRNRWTHSRWSAMRFMGNGITSCYPDEVDNFISITVLSEETTRMIVEHTGGHPLFLRIVGCVCSVVAKRRRISRGVVMEGIARLVRNEVLEGDLPDPVSVAKQQLQPLRLLKREDALRAELLLVRLAQRTTLEQSTIPWGALRSDERLLSVGPAEGWIRARNELREAHLVVGDRSGLRLRFGFLAEVMRSEADWEFEKLSEELRASILE